MTDTDRLAEIRERRSRAHSPCVSGNVFVPFLSGDIDWLLARIAELEGAAAGVRAGVIAEAVHAIEVSKAFQTLNPFGVNESSQHTYEHCLTLIRKLAHA